MSLSDPAGRIGAPDRIGAVVAAAGQSRRMGRSKLTLPWGGSTVIGRIVQVLEAAGAGEIVVVAGANRDEIETALHGLPARVVFNARSAEDYMLLTLQAGLAALSGDVEACLVALGDNPQIEAAVVRRVIAAWSERQAALVVPSWQMRRGHPWLARRSLWPDLLQRTPPDTPRTFLNDHAAQIEYVVVDDDSILRDLDTPEDYVRERPGS